MKNQLINQRLRQHSSSSRKLHRQDKGRKKAEPRLLVDWTAITVAVYWMIWTLDREYSIDISIRLDMAQKNFIQGGRTGAGVPWNGSEFLRIPPVSVPLMEVGFEIPQDLPRLNYCINHA